MRFTNTMKYFLHIVQTTCNAIVVYSKKLERIVWEKEKSHSLSNENDRFNSSPVDETAAAEFETHDVRSFSLSSFSFCSYPFTHAI